MSKKFLFVSFLLSMMFILLVACGNKEATESNQSDSSSKESIDQEVYELIVNNYYSSNHQWAVDIYEPWKEFVEEETDGRITVTINHAGSLGTVDTALTDLQGGLYDLAYIAPSLHPDTELYPLTIGTLPFALPDSIIGGRVMEKFAEEYGEFNDMVFLGMASSDPFMLISREPIETVEDIQGKKINITGKNDQILIEDWGGTSVSLPRPDRYDALQKNTVDGIFNSVVDSVGTKYYEVAPNLLNLGLMAQPIVFAMNESFYDQLPEDLQEMMSGELSAKLVELFSETFKEEVEISIEEYEKQTAGKGGVVTLNDEEEMKFKAAAEEGWKLWEEEAIDKGYSGEEMIEYFKELLKDEGIDIPF